VAAATRSWLGKMKKNKGFLCEGGFAAAAQVGWRLGFRREKKKKQRKEHK
jgi:hypothetical protein